jgi:hypothetical protein
MPKCHQISGEIQANSVHKTVTSQGNKLRERFYTKIETRRQIKVRARRRAEMIARLYKMRVCCQNGQIMIFKSTIPDDRLNEASAAAVFSIEHRGFLWRTFL